MPGSTAKPNASQFISERTLKRFAIVVALMLFAYLVGFVPGWLSSNELKDEVARLNGSNEVLAVKTDLAAASLHAGQGRFDEAIAAAGSFFDKLDKEIVAADGILNNEPAREAAVNMLARRDDIVAMLARGDQNASGVLAGWYFELESLTNGGT